MTDRKKLQSYDLVNEDKQEQPYSDGPKAHYIKTDGNNLEGDGVLSPEEIVKYQSAKYLFLITEDDDVQQGILEGNLRRSINPRTLDDTLILTASSVKEASDLLGKCRQYAPSASLVVSLDYHMGQNDPGERTPTEVLFKNEDLIHYLTKGPVAAVSYTGYPAAVMQSPAIQEAIGTYQDFAFFVADKAEVNSSHVAKFMASITNNGNPSRMVKMYSSLGSKVKYNLNGLMNFIEERRRRK